MSSYKFRNYITVTTSIVNITKLSTKINIQRSQWRMISREDAIILLN